MFLVQSALFHPLKIFPTCEILKSFPPDLTMNRCGPYHLNQILRHICLSGRKYRRALHA